jgi:hypothetical protein
MVRRENGEGTVGKTSPDGFLVKRGFPRRRAADAFCAFEILSFQVR